MQKVILVKIMNKSRIKRKKINKKCERIKINWLNKKFMNYKKKYYYCN